MSDWHAQLIGALQARDRQEKANESLFAACRYAVSSEWPLPEHTIDTKLADKSADRGNKPFPHPLLSNSGQHVDATSSKKTSAHATPDDILRQDLTEAQRSRKLLESRLQDVSKELSELKIQSGLDSNRVINLSKERDQLSRRVKDRDEEIKGKAKLLEDLHDETLSLTLQLNLADEQRQKVEMENEQLVERWMKRMGEEANQMNQDSNFS